MLQSECLYRCALDNPRRRAFSDRSWLNANVGLYSGLMRTQVERRSSERIETSIVRFYSSIDLHDIVLNFCGHRLLHRTDFDVVVPRKLISKMQAFSQGIHVRISARRALSCWEVEVWASTRRFRGHFSSSGSLVT